MPLETNAPAGSPGFSRNVATEVKAGKPEKQAVAIAYSKARGDEGEFGVATQDANDQQAKIRAKVDEIRDIEKQYGQGRAKRPPVGSPERAKCDKIEKEIEDLRKSTRGDADRKPLGYAGVTSYDPKKPDSHTVPWRVSTEAEAKRLVEQAKAKGDTKAKYNGPVYADAEPSVVPSLDAILDSAERLYAKIDASATTQAHRREAYDQEQALLYQANAKRARDEAKAIPGYAEMPASQQTKLYSELEKKYDGDRMRNYAAGKRAAMGRSDADEPVADAALTSFRFEKGNKVGALNDLRKKLSIAREHDFKDRVEDLKKEIDRWESAFRSDAEPEDDCNDPAMDAVGRELVGSYETSKEANTELERLRSIERGKAKPEMVTRHQNQSTKKWEVYKSRSDTVEADSRVDSLVSKIDGANRYLELAKRNRTPTEPIRARIASYEAELGEIRSDASGDKITAEIKKYNLGGTEYFKFELFRNGRSMGGGGKIPTKAEAIKEVIKFGGMFDERVRPGDIRTDDEEPVMDADPRDLAAKGQIQFGRNYKPKAGDYVDYFSKSNPDEKKYGKVSKVDGTKITINGEVFSIVAP